MHLARETARDRNRGKNRDIDKDINRDRCRGRDGYGDRDTYINKMKNTTTLGGGIEIKCFCNIYNMSVIVNHKNKKIEFLPDNTNYVKRIELYYTGNHYEPVKQK